MGPFKELKPICGVFLKVTVFQAVQVLQLFVKQDFGKKQVLTGSA